MNWLEVVKLFRDIFAYAELQILVYILEENGVHAMSGEVDAESYAYNEKERYNEEFFLENVELETDFTKDSKSCQPTCDNQFPVLREKDHNKRLIDQYLQYQPKELNNYVKEFGFQYSDLTDEEWILLIDMLIGARDNTLNISSIWRDPVKISMFHWNSTLKWKNNDLAKIHYSWGGKWKNYSHN